MPSLDAVASEDDNNGFHLKVFVGITSLYAVFGGDNKYVVKFVTTARVFFTVPPYFGFSLSSNCC